MADLVVELIFSLVILAVSFGVSIGVTRFTKRLIQGYARRTRTTLDEEILPVLNKPLGVVILLVGVEIALLRLEFIQAIPMLAKGVEVGFPVVWTLLSGFVAYGLVSILFGHLAHLRRESHPGLASTVKPVGTMVRLAIMGIVFFTILNIFGIDIAPYVLGWGLLGFAIVLALQPILQDMFTGLYVSVAQPYKVGDTVQLPSGEICEIKDIKAQQAVLYNLVDQSYIRIPNTDFMKIRVVSPGESGMPLTVPFKLTNDSDVDLAKRLAGEIASSIPEVSKDPEPSAYLTQLDGPSANFEILCWIKDPAARRSVLDSINTRLRVLFKERGLRFPA